MTRHVQNSTYLFLPQNSFWINEFEISFSCTAAYLFSSASLNWPSSTSFMFGKQYDLIHNLKTTAFCRLLIPTTVEFHEINRFYCRYLYIKFSPYRRFFIHRCVIKPFNESSFCFLYWTDLYSNACAVHESI